MADLNVALILRLVDKATAPAREVMRKFNSFGAEMRGYGASQIALSREQIAAAQDRTRALNGEAMALAGTGYAMFKALQPAIGFEQAMARVGAVSRASEHDLERLTASARQLGRETPWSASQAASGMQYLAMAGFSAGEVIEAMPGMLSLASAGATDLGVTADIASNILTGFNMKAAETGRVGDVLVNTFTTSNTTLGSLGETMKYVAPVAASLGVDFETAAAMAGKLGDAGIQGSEAGTGLRAVISRLAAPTNGAADVLDQLGVSTVDASGNMREITEVLADLEEAMSGYGSAARAEMIKTLFETEAMSSATVLLGQAGSGALQSYIQSLRETGSAARVAKEMNDTTSGALKELASRMEGLSISIGTMLIPAISDLIGKLIPIIDRFNEWAEANQDLIQIIALVAAGLFGLRVALLLGRFAVQTLVIAYWGLNAAMAAAIWTMGAAPAVIRAMGIAFTWTAGAARAAGLAMLANPIFLAIAAIAAAVYVIYDNWSGLVAFFSEKIDKVRAAFQVSLLEGVLTALSQFNPFRLMMEGAVGLIEYLTGWDLSPITRAIKEAFSIDLFEAGVQMIRSLWDGISSLIEEMIASVEAKLSGMMPDWLKTSRAGDAPTRGATGTVDSGPTRYSGRALGGPVRAGQIYRWQEEGEEFFSPATDGTVVPARDVRALKAGGGAASRRTEINLGGIVIHAAAGMSPDAIAQAVRREFERLTASSGDLHDGGAYA